MEIKVDYVHHCGDDADVVEAARVSFAKHGLRKLRHLEHRDHKLIHFLADHEHFSPFKHQFISMHVQAPIFVARQLVKHEYMPWNEVSGRYVEFKPEVYWPDKWRLGSKDIKQGSLFEAAPVSISENDAVQSVHDSFRAYESLLSEGACREQARMVLPLNTMTTWRWSGVLHAWMKMINLRLHSTTQKETQDVALQAFEVIKTLFPVASKALLLEDYRL